MMHSQKVEPMFSKPSLKGFLWLGLFVLQSGSSGIQMIAEVGKEAKLPCEYKMPAGHSLKSYNVYWQKPAVGNPDLVVIAYKDGQKMVSYMDPSYVNRTTMNEQDLTLSISSVKVSDIGEYKCIIIFKTDQISETSVSLSVMANYSKPKIHVDEPHKVCGLTQLTLKCSSHGGYPRTAMFGFPSNSLAQWDYTSTIDTQTKLFIITGNVTLNMTLNVTKDTVVQCSVGSEDFKVSTNYSLNRFLGMTKLCPVPPLPGITHICIVIFIFLVFVVLLSVSIRNCKRSRSSCHTSPDQPAVSAGMLPQQHSNGTSEVIPL